MPSLRNQVDLMRYNPYGWTEAEIAMGATSKQQLEHKRVYQEIQVMMVEVGLSKDAKAYRRRQKGRLHFRSFVSCVTRTTCGGSSALLGTMRTDGKKVNRGLCLVSRARLLAADEARRVDQQFQFRGSEMEAFRGFCLCCKRPLDVTGLGARRVAMQCGRRHQPDVTARKPWMQPWNCLVTCTRVTFHFL